MAKTESTAVNDLIKITATQTPLRSDPSEDLMFAIPAKADRKKQQKLAPSGTDVAPLSRDRAPHGTQQNAIAMPAMVAPPPLPPAARSSAAIAVPPVSLSSAAREPISQSAFEPVMTRTTTKPALPPPSRAPAPSVSSRPGLPSEYPVVSAVHSLPMAPAPQPRLVEEAAPWGEGSLDVDVAPFHGESTAQVARPRTNLEWMIKLLPVAGLMIVLGVLIGGYLVLESKGDKQPASAAAPVAADIDAIAAPAAAEPVAVESAGTVEVKVVAEPTPVAVAAPVAPVFVDVRIDSTPPGATVLLVDRGKQMFLGTTPISTAVDPTRTYEVVFSHPRRPTQAERLDPKAGNRLAVVLSKNPGRAIPEVVKPAPIAAPVAAKLVKPTKVAKLAEPAWDTQIEKAAAGAKPVAQIEKTVEAVPAEKAVGGTGVLMISSKPPCEIHVDGKATGLRTPQRALPLAAGKHRITLVSPELKLKKSFAVEITANESTKVIQDLMK